MHHQHARPLEHQTNRREITLHIVRRLACHGGVHGECGRCEQQRVAIRRGFRHQFRAHHRAAAFTIEDHHVLPQALAEFFGGHATDEIGDASG